VRSADWDRFLRFLRRQRCDEFVEQWGVCEAGHVLTPTNRDDQGRCWVCTRGFERAFEAEEEHAARRPS
jgi:hypothetical protein